MKFFIWTIGVLFTSAFALHGEKLSVRQQFTVLAMIVLFWPLVLGFAVRDAMEKRKEDDDQKTDSRQ